MLADNGSTILTAIGEYNNRRIVVNELNAADGTVASTQYKTTDNTYYSVFALEARGNSVFMVMGPSVYRMVMLVRTTGTFTGKSASHLVDYLAGGTVNSLYGMKLSTDSLLLAGNSDSRTKAYASAIHVRQFGCCLNEI